MRNIVTWKMNQSEPQLMRISYWEYVVKNMCIFTAGQSKGCAKPCEGMYKECNVEGCMSSMLSNGA